jgi:hypothetical protein
MKTKSFLCVFWIVLMISWFALVGYDRFGAAQSSKNVGGMIASDTTWIEANSPYNLTANILVSSGATLTIEADITLNLNNHYIRVDGALIIKPGVIINIESAVEDGSIQVNGIIKARGTRNNPIQINGAVSGQYLSPDYSSITFSQSSVDWNEINGSGSMIENTIIHSTYLDIRHSLRVANVTFIDGEINIFDGSPVISNSNITGRISVSGGSPIIAGNDLTGGFISLYGKSVGENVIISDNVISSAKTSMGKGTAGIWFGGSQEIGGHVLIQRNLITGNQEGIQIFRPNSEELKTSLTIQNNTIIGNTVAISVLSRCSLTIMYNNIYNNSFSIQLSQDASSDIDAAYNWWGMTDSKTISQSIFDSKNDSTLGTVKYEPCLTALNLNATPHPNLSLAMIPAPTMMPTPTPSVSAMPNETSSPEPTSTPKPVLSQESRQKGQLETIIGVGITVIVCGAGLGFLAYLVKKS